MPSHFPPTPVGRPQAPHPTHVAARPSRLDRLRETEHRVQRAFFVANAVPFAIGITLSCFTDVPAVQVHGKLNLGIVWGLLQCALFVTTAWLYEKRSARSSDPIAESLTSGAPNAEMSDAASANGSWR